jgi:hypothetical protein
MSSAKVIENPEVPGELSVRRLLGTILFPFPLKRRGFVRSAIMTTRERERETGGTRKGKTRCEKQKEGKEMYSGVSRNVLPILGECFVWLCGIVSINARSVIGIIRSFRSRRIPRDSPDETIVMRVNTLTSINARRVHPAKMILSLGKFSKLRSHYLS